jgi:hypothetical protein
MTDQITHVGFFGDGEHRFTLTDEMIAELERITGTGIAALYVQVAKLHFNAATLSEIIRLGLIGAGMAPEIAMRLIAAYARNRPIDELLPLALDVLDARWTGVAPKVAA